MNEASGFIAICLFFWVFGCTDIPEAAEKAATDYLEQREKPHDV